MASKRGKGLRFQVFWNDMKMLGRDREYKITIFEYSILMVKLI